ncbi:hypothetical protein H9P43_002682 [Blastocladiella emersonii ATCC 22665]|nr:hypothetical protein H9P43_002682 [Blastocladiella emersonii ATCC 22665]
MSFAARGALRQVKNVAKGYTEIQAKVREATSNDPGPANVALMREIAAASHYDQQFVEIMIIMEKRLNDDGRNWRHVYKALALLEFMVLHGSDRILQYARDNLFVVKTLREFQYRDEAGIDHGQSVRQKATKITTLLSSDEALQREKAAQAHAGDRVSGRASSPYSDPAAAAAREEEEQVRRAIQESLRTAEQEQYRSGGGSASAYGSAHRSHSVPRNLPSSTSAPAPAARTDVTGGLSEEEQLQRAIELSKREEEERQRRGRGGYGAASASLSYGNSGFSTSSPAPTQKPKNELIDLLGGEEMPIAPAMQQPQSTGYPLQLQPTGVSDPFGMPAQNPFNMIPVNATGYSQVPSQMTGFGGAGSAMDPFGNPAAAAPMPAMPTGNPFAATHQTGSTFSMPLGASATGSGMMPMMPTGAASAAAFNPFAAANAGGPARPASTPPSAMPKGPSVDLDNLGPPNRNPFAMTSSVSTSATGNGAGPFNWSGQPEQPKLSLAELAMQRQQQGMGMMPMGMAQTGPAGFGAPQQQPMGMNPTGAGMGMMMPMATGPAAMNPFGGPAAGRASPFGQPPQQQQQPQQQNNPFF